MLALAHGSGDVVVSDLTIAWGAVVAFIGLMSGLAGIAAYVRPLPVRRRITYAMSFCSPLVDRSVVPGLHVSYEGAELGDPHVLAYRGRGDIPGSSFEGQPFSIDVGVPLLGVIDRKFMPEDRPPLKVEAAGTELRLGPGLVRSGQRMRLVVLADGKIGQLSHESPLPDVGVRQQAAEVKGSPRSLRKVMTWAIVIFVAYYLITNPGGAANTVHSALNGLGSVGRSLGSFVNSL